MENVSKSSKRGFFGELALQHANTLIEYVNTYIDRAVEYKDTELVLARAEWALIRYNVGEAFKKLKTF